MNITEPENQQIQSQNEITSICGQSKYQSKYKKFKWFFGIILEPENQQIQLRNITANICGKYK